MALSRQAGMAEVATGVLHNVGNVLNSVMTAAALALERLHQSQVAQLAKAVALIDAHADDLGAFITSDPHGQHLPMFLRHLAQHLLNERETIIQHLHTVNDRIEHIKEIVILQQSYATTIGIIEPIDLTTLMDDAIKTQDDNFDKYEVEIVREYAELPLVLTDRHKVLQILINLLSNAKHALLAVAPAGRRLTVRVGAVEAYQVCLEVEDNGVGIGASDPTACWRGSARNLAGSCSAWRDTFCAGSTALYQTGYYGR
jgi:signal transduction histidine kinase